MVLSKYTVGTTRDRIRRSKNVAFFYSAGVAFLMVLLHWMGQKYGWGEGRRDDPTLAYLITIFVGNFMAAFAITFVALSSFPARGREPENYRRLRVIGGYIAIAIGFSNAYVHLSNAAVPSVKGGFGIIGSFLLASWFILASSVYGAMFRIGRRR